MQIRHVLCGTVLNGVSIHNFPVHKLLCSKQESLPKRHAQPLTKGTHSQQPPSPPPTPPGEVNWMLIALQQPPSLAGKIPTLCGTATSNNSIPTPKWLHRISFSKPEQRTHYRSLGPRSVFYRSH